MVNKNVSLLESLKFGARGWLDHVAFFLWIRLITFSISAIALVSFVVMTGLAAAGTTCIKSALAPGGLSQEMVLYCLKYSWAVIGSVTGLLFFLGIMLLWTLFDVGRIRMALDIVDTGATFTNRLFDQYRAVLPAFFAWIVSLMAILAGIIALIIPGLVLSVLFTFVTYVIVDKQVCVFTALRESIRLVLLAPGAVVGYLIFCLAIGLMLGKVSLLLHVLLAPFYLLVTAHLYRQLTDFEEKEATQLA